MASNRLVIFLLLLMLTKLFTVSFCDKCTNPLPGLMLLASGVDITSLELVPLGDPKSNHGLVENVFNFTCSGTQFEYTLDKDFISYDVPDQIFVRTLHNDFDSDSVSFMSDASSLKATLMSRLFLQDGWQSSIGTFSRNPKYTSLLKQYFNANKTFSKIETIASTILTQVNPFQKGTSRVKQGTVSSSFLKFVTQKLPPKYEDDPPIYQTFVQRFGTHYFSQTQLSDYTYLVFALNRDYLFDTRDDQLSDNMRVAYFDYFKRWDSIISKNISNNMSQRDSFANVSEIALAYSARKNGSWWEDKLTGARYSVAKQFRNFSIRWTDLQSVANLIDNRTIREQVEIAIIMHRTVAQFEELTNIYKFSNYQFSSEEKVAFERAGKLVHNCTNRKQVDQLHRTVHDLYYRVLQVKDRDFYQPLIDDLYVTAAAKLAFAKQICAFSFGRFMRGQFTAGQCEAPDIRDVQRETNHLFDVIQLMNTFPAYDNVEYSLYLRHFQEARSLNLHYGLRADIANGLSASCGKC